MSKSGNFGEERAKVLGKFMFLMDSNEQPSQLKISVNNPVLPTQERSLETIRMLASGPTKIKQPLYRTHDMMDEEEEQGAVLPMAEFSQLPLVMLAMKAEMLLVNRLTIKICARPKKSRCKSS